MKRVSCQIGLLTIFGVLSCTVGFGQSSAPAPAPSQNPSPAPTASPSQPQGSANSAATPPADAKKQKKVWTNDDVGSLNGSVSVVGNSKNLGKANSGGGGTADGQYIASTKKELAKLQAELDDTDKQLADLKDFSQGKAPTTSSGYQINKGYNRVPVDQQITSLEDKKKQVQGKIDALIDEARKRGVEPGQLR